MPSRRILMLRPTERDELATLAAVGFSDYLVKPVRAASLAGRFGIPAGDVATAGLAVPEPAAPVRDRRDAEAGRRVLVAEDNEINALLVRAMLERLGHRVTVTGDGDAAVIAWQRARADGRPFELVLMDLHMPGLDGLAATRRIRDLEAEQGDAPTVIIALTADASPAEPEAFRAAGLDAMLVKPLDRDRLEAALAGLAARGALAA
jgi:CheY-like chemotaxis protein